MRPRSLTGPLILVIIGGLFLWRNLHPEAPIYEIFALYWPFLLVLWGVLRLIEVAWPGSPWKSGFSGGEVVLVILVCLLGSAMWAGYRNGIHWNGEGLSVFGNEYDYPVSAKAPAAGMKRIVFDIARGNIKVTGADTQEVAVSGNKTIRSFGREDADRANNNTPIEVVPEGDHLLVRANQDRASNNQRVSDDIEVTVPRAMAVEARGRRGDFEIGDIDGDVVLGGAHGDVRLSRLGGNARVEVNHSETIRAVDVKGHIDVQGEGSDLSLENVQGQVTISGAFTGTLDFKNLAKPLQFEGARNTELHVEAVPGNISMDMGEFTANGLVGPVRLITRSRDIKIGRFSQTMTVETEHGNIELDPGMPVPAIEARSGAGNIELTLPEKAAFQLNATAERGDATNDFGEQIQKESFGRSATLKGRVGDGPSIRLTASHGEVEVRKGDDSVRPPDTPAAAPAAPAPPAQPKAPAKNLKDSEIKL
ncbi:MAG: DUF4097 family beta strand repeat-containing protein [Bryobacteraceae bacterium]|jgi:DUF4097 and DUF4098 domain-containing protein YvlB